MPVNFFDLDAMKFYLVILVIGSPVVLVVGMIVYFIRQTDKAVQRRGFEIKPAGQQPATEKERDDHDLEGDGPR